MGRFAIFGLLVMGMTACGEVNSSPQPDAAGDPIDAGSETFSVGGMVNNLLGTGLVLRNNGGDDLSVSASGSFTFETELGSGDDFAVTVATQPSGPVQVCTVSGGTGTVGTDDVTTVTVDCVTNGYTIGGTVTGLVGTATLTNTLPGGGTDTANVSANGTYAFPTAVPSGSSYDVDIFGQPAGSYCYVGGPTGSVGAADVTTVDLGCVATPIVSAIASACGTSTSAIQWAEVPGATYTVQYGLAGSPTTVNLSAGTTSYTPSPALGPGDYVARVQAHRGGLDGIFSADQPFQVGATPVVNVSNNGPACVGGGVSLTTTPAGATYAWTGPGGFTSTAQSPALTGLGSTGNMTGTYSVTVTVNGCSNSGSTTVATSSVAGSFAQTSTADFNANANSNVTTASNQVQLAEDLVLGSGGSSVTYLANTTIAGGTHEYANFTINAGVTVTVTGNQALIIRATGTVTLNGVIEASGANGTNGVTSTSAGVGGAGVAGGGIGGNGFFVASGGPFNGFTGGGFGPGQPGSSWGGGGGAGYALVGGTPGGQAYGTAAITTITGGSGGGGGSGGNNCGGGGGGGGGGYVQISANTITTGANGGIRSNGGTGGTDGGGSCGGGGGGSGGSIHLRARTLTVAGPLSAIGGTGGTGWSGSTVPTGGTGSVGRIRLDAGTRNVTGAVTPASGMNGGVVVTPGSSRTVSIAPTNMCTWGTVSYTSATPSGSTFGVNVLNGTTNAVILSNVASGTNISGSVGPSTPIKLEAQLSSTGSTATLSDWTVSYTTR